MVAKLGGEVFLRIRACASIASRAQSSSESIARGFAQGMAQTRWSSRMSFQRANEHDAKRAIASESRKNFAP